MHPFTEPPGYTRVQVVDSFEGLLSTPFRNGCNAVCWKRNLLGDYSEVVQALEPDSGIQALSETQLAGMTLGPAGDVARQVLLEDLRLLKATGHTPSIECVREYPRDSGGPLPTDVYSLHVDSAPVPAETFLCSYTGLPSEGLRVDEAQPWVEDADTRARLLRAFGGEEGPAFLDYLREGHYDLHFAPKEGAQPFSFGTGNLWRVAVQYPQARVPAFIHRAPDPSEYPEPRLLLIS